MQQHARKARTVHQKDWQAETVFSLEGDERRSGIEQAAALQLGEQRSKRASLAVTIDADQD